MTATTIKVPKEIRDALKAQAGAYGRTLGEHLAVLIAHEERRQRFVQLRNAMADNPPDDEYLAELNEWQSDVWS